uniref:Uncharacterized protein n=1 Tax=Glossina brevipalpis TaxID=37001 RepID=A0A1A9X3G7_9MUSC
MSSNRFVTSKIIYCSSIWATPSPTERYMDLFCCFIMLSVSPVVMQLYPQKSVNFNAVNYRTRISTVERNTYTDIILKRKLTGVVLLMLTVTALRVLVCFYTLANKYTQQIL